MVQAGLSYNVFGSMWGKVGHLPFLNTPPPKTLLNQHTHRNNLVQHKMNYASKYFVPLLKLH